MVEELCDEVMEKEAKGEEVGHFNSRESNLITKDFLERGTEDTHSRSNSQAS